MKGPVIVPFFINQLGCPHRCVYCAQQAINGQSGRLPTAAVIRDTVAAYRATAGTRALEIAFYGGSFTCLPRESQQALLAPAAALCRDGVVTGIRVSTRPDAVDATVAAFLAQYGVTTVELGVQSLADQVLRAAGRGHDATVVGPAVAALTAVGCRVGLQLMPGLPDDTPATALASVRDALLLKPDFLRIYPTVVMAGTPLALAHAVGEYQPWSLEQAIVTVKRMLLMAMRAGVPVRRIGLQQSASLAQPDTVIAGPHHPALGELVLTALWRDLLQSVTAGVGSGPLEIRCHPGRVSALTGHRRSNLAWLAAQTSGAPAQIIGDPSCSPTQLVLITPGSSRTGDLLKDVNYDDTI